MITELVNYIRDFSDEYLTMPKIYLSDIVEVFIIAVIVYYVLIWFKNTRAWVIFRGMVVLMGLLFVATIFNLSTILWLSNKVLNIAILAIVIIFQPELRKALEDLGNRNIFFYFFRSQEGSSTGRFSDKSLDDIIRATVEMAKNKTGALIVIARNNNLDEYINTGISLNAEISSQLLINIFEHNTPLHDGAVVIENNKIIAATCYLPLSNNLDLSKDLGTRHRAGVGVSEESDAFVIIVSEETGAISIASHGKLTRHVDSGMLKKELVKAQNKTAVKEKKQLKKNKKTKLNRGRRK